MPRPVLLMISSLRGGGSERQTLLLLKHLDRTRFTPHLYLTDRVGELLRQVPGDVTIHSFADSASTGGLYYPGRALGQQVQHLRDLLVRESIGVIYDRTFHMTMIAGPAALPLDIPRVSTIVSPPHHALPLVENRFVWLKRRRLAKAYRQSQAVIAVSTQAAQSAHEYYGLKSDALHVILNPVDVEAVREAANEASPERDERITIVCVGRMSAEKGHQDLLSALAKSDLQWPEDVQPIRLWMVGDGPLRSDLERQWQSLRCRHEVEFLGPLGNPAPAIAKADALVLPSLFEGMPNVVLEAMALKTPVIATRVGGAVELERDRPTILWAEARKPETMADALLQFAADRQSAINRAEAAMDLIHQYHDPKVTTENIQLLLEGTGVGRS